MARPRCSSRATRRGSSRPASAPRDRARAARRGARRAAATAHRAQRPPHRAVPPSRHRSPADAAPGVMRLGRLGPRREAPYEIVDRDRHHRLRRYEGGRGPAIVLVPPLMLTAEIYDVAPELSAVAALGASGLDPWVVDFGAP